MIDTIRDTSFGHILRSLFGPKILPYPEELDSSLWQKYVHVEKSGLMAHHGTTRPDNDFLAEERELQGERIDEESGGQTMFDNSRITLVNEISGVHINSEKGKDIDVVDWSGPDDPDVILCFVFPCTID
jgi:DHA1 family multidrug resistance protein-like MFS transporter